MDRSPEEEKEIMRRGLSRTSALLSDQNFAWFLEECIGKRMAELDMVLHDVNRSSEERDKALERWDELDKARTWAREQRAMFQRDLGHAVTAD